MMLNSSGKTTYENPFAKMKASRTEDITFALPRTHHFLPMLEMFCFSSLLFSAMRGERKLNITSGLVESLFALKYCTTYRTNCDCLCPKHLQGQFYQLGFSHQRFKGSKDNSLLYQRKWSSSQFFNFAQAPSINFGTLRLFTQMEKASP